MNRVTISLSTRRISVLLGHEIAVRNGRPRAQEAEEAVCVALLRKAATKLAQARECRAVASTIENGRASALLSALALDFEKQAQELARQAEELS